MDITRDWWHNSILVHDTSTLEVLRQSEKEGWPRDGKREKNLAWARSMPGKKVFRWSKYKAGCSSLLFVSVLSIIAFSLIVLRSLFSCQSHSLSHTISFFFLVLWYLFSTIIVHTNKGFVLFGNSRLDPLRPTPQLLFKNKGIREKLNILDVSYSLNFLLQFAYEQGP